MTDLATLLQMLDAPLLAAILAIIWRMDRRLIMLELTMKGNP